MRVMGAVAIAASQTAPAVSDEAQLLSAQLPQLTEKASLAKIPLPSWLESFRGRLNAFVQENLKTAMLAAMPFARSVGTEILLFVGNLIFVALVPILAFF